MLMIDDTVVNVALPSIGRDLRFGAELLPWVVDAYMLLFGGFLILNGRVADIFGRRRMFIAGLFLFTTGSLVAGVSETAMALVVARGVQGFGGALLAPAALGTLAAAFQSQDGRRRALGVWSAVTGLSGIAGVLLGGIVTGILGWRWVFLINVPAAVLILIMLLLGYTPSDPNGVDPSRLDLPGAVLGSAGLLILVWAVLNAPADGWLSPPILALFGVAVLLLIAFLFWQAHTRSPILDLRLFRLRSFSTSAMCMLLAAAGMYSMVFFLTQYMQTVQGWSPIRTGISWLSFGALFMIATGASIKLTPRVGARNLMVAGGVLASIGQLLLLRTAPQGGYWSQLAPAIAFMGAGIGLAFMPVYVTAMHGHDARDSSVVSGVIGTMQQIGGALGVAALGSVAISRYRYVLSRTGNARIALVDGFHRSFLLAALCMLALGAAALFLPSIVQDVDIETIQGLRPHSQASESC